MGIGLYSSDFALDLRGSVKAVACLPFEPDRLLDYLCAAEPQAANNPKDSDHTIFWLTVADQFAKRGVDCPRARDRALAIIDEGADLAAMASLGMEERSLVKRRAMLEDLRARIARPVETAKPRAVLKAPQRLLLAVGEVLTYPTCKGEPINPYAVGKEWEWEWVKAWKDDEGRSGRGSGELERLNLSGQWQGQFSYATDKREPVSFVATFREHDSWLNGEIEETGAVADAAGRTLHATLQGRRLGRAIKFLKVYAGSFHRYGSVQYEGEISDDAAEIAGWWTVPGSWSGRFVMARSKSPAKADEMPSTQALSA